MLCAFLLVGKSSTKKEKSLQGPVTRAEAGLSPGLLIPTVLGPPATGRWAPGLLGAWVGLSPLQGGGEACCLFSWARHEAQP